MIINKCIDTIYQHHEDWLNIARSYLIKKVNSDIYEDIVQEMYIKLSQYADCDKLVFEDGRVNKSYIFLTIRGLCFNLLNETKGIHKEDTSQLIRSPDQVDERAEAYERLMAKIDLEIESWDWYDRQLFKLYKDTPFSLRGLSKQTGISWVSIHNTVKNCKAILKEKFSEDWEDYTNGDYHLI